MLCKIYLLYINEWKYSDLFRLNTGEGLEPRFIRVITILSEQDELACLYSAFTGNCKKKTLKLHAKQTHIYMNVKDE